MGQLQQERLAADLAKAEASPTRKAKVSFWNKVSEHWLVLATAVFFDLFAWIPLVSVIVNGLFGLFLLVYFGPKKKDMKSELLRIGLPIAGGSILDWFFSFLPVNIAAALIRIAFD